MPNIRLGRHARRWITVAVIAVVAASAGATAWAMTGPSGPGYRTAIVARANVNQTLMSTGTIEPVSQANVSFPVSGQVASVSVALGSHVRAGQVLARLSTTALASQVSAAQYAVATATVRLAADQASQTTATSTTSGTGSQGSTAGALAAITRQQAAVRAVQQRLDAKLTAAKALLATETALCAVTPSPTSSPTGAGSPSPSLSSPAAPTVTVSPRPTGTSSSGTKPPGGGPTGGPPPSTCQAAITKLLSAQTGIAATEQSLASSESNLSKALSKASAAVAKPAGSGSSGGSGSGSAAAGSHGATTGATTGAPATAAQLAADQASLDAANAQLSVAQQNLAAATLVAPITGMVTMVNITPGQQVTGSQGSGTTANFVIEGAGGHEAVTTVSDPDVGKIRVGQSATVTLDGSATSISGEVVAIGMLSTTSSTGNASYPVTIGLTSGAPALFAGSDAQVTITLAKVNDAITVPTSAVQGIGAATSVTVLRAGKPVRVRVVAGATGPVLTQISSGLTIGEQVVLADMSTPLPTNTNPFARGLTTGGGGFGGRRPGSGTTGGGTTPTGGNTSGG